MSVLSKIRGFFSRHRNKFIVGGILIGGSIFLSRYAQQKLREWQENAGREVLERHRKQQHFESIGRTCNQTVLTLGNTLNETILRGVKTEEVIERLKLNPDNKLELWNELKVLVFTKATCTIYANVILVVMLKIQLSIIGGYLCKDSNSLSVEAQEKFLSLCQNLLEAGFTNLNRLSEQICRNILDAVNLTKSVKLSDLEAIFWSIQTALATNNNNPIENLREYTFVEHSKANGLEDKLLRETAELLDSDEVKSLATHCINRGFMVLSEQLSVYYQNGAEPVTEQFVNPFDSKKPFAKVLPILNGLFAKNAFSETFLQQLLVYEKVQNLAANIYEAFLG